MTLDVDNHGFINLTFPQCLNVQHLSNIWVAFTESVLQNEPNSEVSVSFLKQISLKKSSVSSNSWEKLSLSLNGIQPCRFLHLLDPAVEFIQGLFSLLDSNSNKSCRVFQVLPPCALLSVLVAQLSTCFYRGCFVSLLVWTQNRPVQTNSDAFSHF